MQNTDFVPNAHRSLHFTPTPWKERNTVYTTYTEPHTLLHNAVQNKKNILHNDYRSAQSLHKTDQKQKKTFYTMITESHTLLFSTDQKQEIHFYTTCTDPHTLL